MKRTTKVRSPQNDLPKITSFDQDDVEWLRSRVNELLGTLKKERGITAKVARNITYGHFDFNIRIDIQAAPSKKLQQQKKTDLEWKATKVGVDSDWIGKEFRDADFNRCTIVDISTRSPRYPIVMERLVYGDKKLTKCTVEFFNKLIKLYN